MNLFPLIVGIVLLGTGLRKLFPLRDNVGISPEAPERPRALDLETARRYENRGQARAAWALLTSQIGRRSKAAILILAGMALITIAGIS